jgi:hypothetical protein
MRRHLAHVEPFILSLHGADVKLPVVGVLELDSESWVATVWVGSHREQTYAVRIPSQPHHLQQRLQRSLTLNIINNKKKTNKLRGP